MGTILKNIFTEPPLTPDGDGFRTVPGLGRIPPGEKDTTRFLGDSEAGPWVYLVERPAGDKVPFHRHKADRIELLLEGEIEWIEHGKEPEVYGSGTFSYVTKGTVYSYSVLKDAKILVIFNEHPLLEIGAPPRANPVR